MKIMKKIAAAALASAALFAFVGCADNAGETGKIGKDFEITNPTESDYYRGWQTLKTKHTSGAALITLPASESTNGAGVVGFIFGIKDVKDADGNTEADVKDFCVVGLRRNAKNQVEAYTAAYKNVSTLEANLNMGNNFADKNGVVIGLTTGSLAKELGDDKNYKNVGKALTGTDDIILRVEVVAGGADTDGDGKVEDGEGDGSYDIAIYNVDTDGETRTGSALYTASLTSADTGDTKATQYDLGLYTNVYKGQTLKGKLWLTDLVNEAGIELD